MNRRSFLKFCGIAPVVPMVAVEIFNPIIEFDELMFNFCMYRLRQHRFWNINDHIGKDGTLSMYIKSDGLWERYYFDVKTCQPHMQIVNKIKNKDLVLRHTFFINDAEHSILEFNTLIKYKDSYIDKIKIVNLQIAFNTDFPTMEIRKS